MKPRSVERAHRSVYLAIRTSRVVLSSLQQELVNYEFIVVSFSREMNHVDWRIRLSAMLLTRKQMKECWITCDAYPGRIQAVVFQVLTAIATNTSLEILIIKDKNDGYLGSANDRVRIRRALSLKTSLKDIRTTMLGRHMRGALAITISSPNLEALTMHTISNYDDPGIDKIVDLAWFVERNTKLWSLTIGEFNMDSDQPIRPQCPERYLPTHGHA